MDMDMTGKVVDVKDKKIDREHQARLDAGNKVRWKHQYITSYVDAEYWAALTEAKIAVLDEIHEFNTEYGKDAGYAKWCTNGKLRETRDGRVKTGREIFWEMMMYKRSYVDESRKREQAKRELVQLGFKDKDFTKLEEDYGIKNK